jgi:hypothetical protein
MNQIVSPGASGDGVCSIANDARHAQSTLALAEPVAHNCFIRVENTINPVVEFISIEEAA